MFKKILIIGGIAIGFLLLTVAAGYVLFFGAPQSADEVFTNFGFDDRAPQEFTDTSGQIIDTSATDADGRVQTLRQLTVRPVAGMMFVATTTVRYAEQGTGYIYDVDLSTGQETQVSNTTFSHVREAVFSPDGAYVVLTYTDDGAQRVTLGEIVDGELTTANLLAGSDDLQFNTDSTQLYYTLETTSGAVGYRYTLETDTAQTLFSLPFGSIHAIWKDRTYVYTEPTAELRGYIYEIVGGVHNFVTPGHNGLVATYFADGVITTYTDDNGDVATMAHTDTARYQVAVPALPEKCVAVTSGATDLLCGAPLALDESQVFPDTWYKGAVSYADLLWAVDIEAEEAVLLADPVAQTGREIDVLNITADPSGTQFLLINKNDNTLWLFAPITS